MWIYIHVRHLKRREWSEKVTILNQTRHDTSQKQKNYIRSNSLLSTLMKHKNVSVIRTLQKMKIEKCPHNNPRYCRLEESSEDETPSVSIQ